MINPPEWGSGQGWEFPCDPTYVAGGCISTRMFMVVFAQVLTNEQVLTLSNTIGEMTDKEKQAYSALPEKSRRVHVWQLAGLPIAELVLDE